MRHTLRQATAFSLGAVATTLVSDLLFSLLFQPPPSGDLLRGWWIAHGAAHAGILIFGFTGAAFGYLYLRASTPSIRMAIAIGAVFGLISVFAAPGMFMLAGLPGAVGWLVLGAFVIAAVGGKIGTATRHA